MADFAIYWQRYTQEAGSHGSEATGWWTSREWLVNRLTGGDRIWLFVGGDACGDTRAPHAAYLVQLLVVEGWERNPDYDPDDRSSSRFEIVGIEKRCVLLQEPMLVDDLFRQQQSDQRHIGLVRQTPFELDNGEIGRLLPRLQEHDPDVYRAATRG